MKESIDLSQYSVRTDLAIEAREMVISGRQKDNVHEQENLSQIEGVIIKEKEENDIKISFVEVTKEGAEALGKKRANILPSK